ncbi:CTP synthase [Camellia lanceoleosa]|uniref:CTP synthase n=1 Tax=Camellia lanceoleosa TaxID=1840588 RepID=A0ACC0IP80_9ERIC|nr:CTP synthase [Camellia lanceoleosa]
MVRRLVGLLSFCRHMRCGILLWSVCQDPYLNTDAGTMSPFEHGQVFVLDDGGEWVGLLFSCYCWKFRPLDFSAGRFEEETEKSLRERRKDGHGIHFLEDLALSTSCDELSWNWYHEDDSQR